MSLHAERAGVGPRIVLVHGFTQTSGCWGPEAADLIRDHEVVRVDAPGHGGSRDMRADLPTAAHLLGTVGGTGTYLGYSLGARICLTLAVAAPALVRGLVLIGGTAGIEDDQERAARHDQDLQTAARIAFLGLDTFLDGWLEQPLFATLPAERSFQTERRTNSEAGLASSLELAGTGAQAPLWDRLSGLDMPVLVVAGALDQKFSAIGQRMADAIGDNAAVAMVDGAGHAAHLEQPDAFLALVRPWLHRHGL